MKNDYIEQLGSDFDQAKTERVEVMAVPETIRETLEPTDYSPSHGGVYETTRGHFRAYIL